MKPILFNTEMVRAIQANRKTVTRRVVKGANPLWCFDGLEKDPAMAKVRKNGEEYPVDMPGLWALFEWDGYPEYPMVKAPYQPGDILYVRETWRVKEIYGSCGTFGFDCEYKADNKTLPVATKDWNGYCKWGKFFEKDGWCPSIHMPRKAARIFLRVTDVRVERVRDITDDDALKEGCGVWGDVDWIVFPREDFARVWDSTIKPAGRALYGWDANPWVWVIEFETAPQNELLLKDR